MHSRNPIILPGLNQLYYVNNYISYKELENNFKDFLSKNDINFEKSDKDSFVDYKEEILGKINEEKLRNVLDEYVRTNVTFVNEKNFDLIDTDRFCIYVHNKNLFYLLIDKLILQNADFTTKIQYYSMKDIENEYAINNLKIIYLDYDTDNIIEFQNSYKCFTVLLNCYSYCHLDKILNTEENKIQHKIIEFFNASHQLNLLYKDSPFIINRSINFISNNFYQLFYYYNLAIEAKTYEHLCLGMNEINPKIILLFTRTLTRKQEFLKQKNYISSKEILYKPHYGGENCEFNGKFDCILTKAVEPKDLILYKDIFDKLSKYKNANDPSKFWYFIDKNKQSELLNDFIKFPELKTLCEKYNLILECPKDLSIEGNELLDKDKFIKKLNDNNMKFPIIIKYTSEESSFKHLITIIFDEKNFENAIKEITKGENSINAKCLIQEPVNHGGYVLKVYHIGNYNYIDYRSSIPDFDNDFIDEFIKGYWIIKTIDLEGNDYKINIWNKFVKPHFISDKIEKNDRKKFVIEICNLFSKFTNFSFYGVDLLYDYVNNKFIIIDANALPSYKIPNFKSELEFQNFFKGFN
jgi:hypothetical protein